jgi:hypothetical protein
MNASYCVRCGRRQTVTVCVYLQLNLKKARAEANNVTVTVSIFFSRKENNGATNDRAYTASGKSSGKGKINVQ